MWRARAPGAGPVVGRTAPVSTAPSESTSPAGRNALSGWAYLRALALVGDLLNLDENFGHRVSNETVRATWEAAAAASPLATWACPPGWLEDFSQGIERIDVPTLILHGTADRILSIEGQGRRLHEALPDARYVEIDGGPHVVCVTHVPEVNRELLAFLRQDAPIGAAA